MYVLINVRTAKYIGWNGTILKKALTAPVRIAKLAVLSILSDSGSGGLQHKE